MIAVRFIFALFDWLFIPHGYDPFGIIASSKRLPLFTFKCKTCGNKFNAMKRNDTCHKIKCFIKYRLRSK